MPTTCSPSFERLGEDRDRHRAVGDYAGATRLLMDILCQDLRCIDAHAHLGNWELERSPARAMVHYEIGIRIGELSLPPDFDVRTGRSWEESHGAGERARRGSR